MKAGVKNLVKKVAYPAMDWVDTAIPPLSTWVIRGWCRFRDINDLRIPETYRYDPLGPYVTLHQKRPGFYARFLKTYTFDQEGLPYLFLDGAVHYPVVLVAQFGLAEYGYYLDTGEQIHRENCLKAAEKLLMTQDARGGWAMTFDHYRQPVNDTLRTGWYCAIGQGQAISLFARANALAPNTAYMEAAHKSLEIFQLPVQDGGVRTKIGAFDFFEEYPTTPPSFTLNGFIFSVIGLYDGFRVFGDALAGELFDSAVCTLKGILPLYDDMQVTPYDLSHLTNPPKIRWRDRKYHILHVKLLQAIQDIAPDDIFAFYINKWGRNWR